MKLLSAQSCSSCIVDHDNDWRGLKHLHKHAQVPRICECRAFKFQVFEAVMKVQMLRVRIELEAELRML